MTAPTLPAQSIADQMLEIPVAPVREISPDSQEVAEVLKSIRVDSLKQPHIYLDETLQIDGGE